MVLGVFLLVAAVGCGGGRSLVATPYLLANSDPNAAFACCPQRCQDPAMEVIYVTDREPIAGAKTQQYGYGRSKRVAFGTAQVQLDPMPTWQELVRDSTRLDRGKSYDLKLSEVREIGAFDAMWDRLEVGPEGFRLAQDAKGQIDGQREKLYGLIQDKLANTNQKDVFIYVHGVNNPFEYNVFRIAELWHFMGRVGVPIVYSWPAGMGGIRGYAYDRESGEFTVFHLKQFLKTVAACPGVERVHVVAHSRGCDVAISAIRELHVASQAQGRSSQEDLKLENLVLAAPDLDEDVFVQRFVAENLLKAAKRTTIYASRRDQVIELADVVFASGKRLGQLGPRDFQPHVRHALARLPNLQFVECDVTRFSTTHDYTFAHPAALSDLILVLRERRDPGIANGRPLKQTTEGIWELTNDYMLAPPAPTPRLLSR